MSSRPFIAAALLAVVLMVSLHPMAALARQSMSFMPGDRSRVHRLAVPRHVTSRGRGRGKAHARFARPARGSHGDEGDEGAARAVPGAGFTMDNGVLTYPAPARFQPKNLKPR